MQEPTLALPQETHLGEDLVAHFEALPPHMKLSAGQGATTSSLLHCFQLQRMRVQSDQLNIEELDPVVIASKYAMYRLQNLLLQDVITFFEHASKYYLTSTQGETPQIENKDMPNA